MVARFLVLAALVVLLVGTATAEQMSVTCTDDSPAGVSDYICQIGSYEASYTFDMSGVPDSWRFREATFSASIDHTTGGETSLWSGATLLATRTLGISGGFVYFDYTVDTDALDWQGEDSITFRLTGPLDGTHDTHAYAQFSESGNPASLTVTNPEPGTLALFGVGLLAAFGIHRRRRASRN